MKWRIGKASFLAAAVAAALLSPGHCQEAPLSPRDAGLRYGQALGVLEVCYGSKLTDKASNLEKSYTGDELEQFKASAAKVYEAWAKVRACTNQRDPNTCKIIMDKSCLAAEAEIGPKGTAMPALVEFIAR